MLRRTLKFATRHKDTIIRSLFARRFIPIAPLTTKSRSWRGRALRWGLAGGLVYWYNTSNLFAEEVAFPIANPPFPSEETSLPTLDTIAPARRKEGSSSTSSTSSPPAPDPPPSPTPQAALETTSSAGLEAAEEEASSEGAFNEETGEINWDCPCLGGMAHGPCGEQFRAAFSCFVYSKEEPKGMNCIEQFKNMQTCFRDHPDIYGGELEDDDDEGWEGAEQSSPPSPGETPSPVPATSTPAPLEATSAGPEGTHNPSTSSGPSAVASLEKGPVPHQGDDATARAKAAKEQVEIDQGEPTSESDELVPKAAHDAR
ncbi:MAG: hypothetical protein Q9163_005125 [Psora crenata]